MNYRVLGKRVVVRPIETDETSSEAPHIVIPPTVRDGWARDQAEVVAVGSGCVPGLAVGDWVLLAAWAKSEAPRALGDGCYLVPEDAVLARLRA